MQHQLAVFDFGCRDLCPVDDLQVFLGIEKWKNLDAQRSQYQIGMLAAAHSQTEKPKPDEEVGNTEPPPALQGRGVHAPFLSR